MMLNTIFLLYCMKLSHINHDEKIYTAVFLNFILTSRIKVKELKKIGYYNLYGIEPSYKNVDYIKKTYQINNVYTGSVGNDKIPISNKTIDLIIMTGVLEHIMELDPFMNDCKRYLSDNGYLCISVPDVMQFSNDIDLYQQFSVEHINFFNKVSINNLLMRYGFENVCFDDSLSGEVIGVWQLKNICAQNNKGNDDGKIAIKNYINECQKLENDIDYIISKYSDTELYLWGAGTHTAMLYQMGTLDKLKIVNIIDSNINYDEKKINGISIIKPQDIKTENYPILISSKWAQESILYDIKEKYKLKNKVITLY